MFKIITSIVGCAVVLGGGMASGAAAQAPPPPPDPVPYVEFIVDRCDTVPSQPISVINCGIDGATATQSYALAAWWWATHDVPHSQAPYRCGLPFYQAMAWTLVAFQEGNTQEGLLRLRLAHEQYRACAFAKAASRESIRSDEARARVR